MKTTVTSTTGQYEITAEVELTGEITGKARKLVEAGVLSAGLYRGCFPDCRLTIAGVPLLDAKGNRSKLPATNPDGTKWDVNRIAYDADVAGKIEGIVRTKLAETCDGVVSVKVSRYVIETDADAGIRNTMKVLQNLVDTGVLAKDTDIRAMATSMKVAKSA